VLSLPRDSPLPPGDEPAAVVGFVLEGRPGSLPPDLGRPAVGGLNQDLFREGEAIEVDGDAGAVTLDGVREVRVVTAFLERSDGKILLLRRSDRVGSFQGQWAAVSGFLEDPTPLEQARREVAEETGVGRSDLELVRGGDPVLARVGETVYIVHPFRFATRNESVRLDWEHTEAEWVLPEEIVRRPTVPKLLEAWEAVGPRPKS
jgi:ADP-ribose pyrophosphatase YjhB (NUDIX family)